MRWLVSLLMAGFTLLMINDFFPSILPFLRVPQLAIIVFVFLIFIGISFFSRKEKEQDRTFKWNIFASFYLMFLIILLSLLGGKSASGISLGSPIVWALLLVSIFKIYDEIKRRRAGDSQEI